MHLNDCTKHRNQDTNQILYYTAAASTNVLLKPVMHAHELVDSQSKKMNLLSCRWHKNFDRLFFSILAPLTQASS